MRFLMAIQPENSGTAEVVQQGEEVKVGGGAEPVGTIEVALNHTARLRGRDPKLAAQQATEILKVAPGHPVALLPGAARRLNGLTEAALGILEPLVGALSSWAAAQYEHVLAPSHAGRSEVAIASLQRPVALESGVQ
jgi:hypothetical protein